MRVQTKVLSSGDFTVQAFGGGGPLHRGPPVGAAVVNEQKRPFCEAHVHILSKPNTQAPHLQRKDSLKAQREMAFYSISWNSEGLSIQLYTLMSTIFRVLSSHGTSIFHNLFKTPSQH